MNHRRAETGTNLFQRALRMRLVPAWYKQVAGALALILLVTGYASPAGADDLSAARQRATLYQTEAMKMFMAFHWVIAANRAGRFTAVHAAYFGGAHFGRQTVNGSFPAVYHVTVTFVPVSAAWTECAANLRFYVTIGGKVSVPGQPPAYRSGPGNDPRMTKYVQDRLKSAENRMVHQHPEYRPY